MRQVLNESLQRLQGEESTSGKSIRWELGACWVQHLQNQASGKDEPKKNEEVKVEPSVKGLGKHGGLLKDLKKKSDDQINKTDSANNNSDANKKELEKDEDKEIVWKKVIPEAAYLRLKESETGLHLKVISLLCNEMYIRTLMIFLNLKKKKQTLIIHDLYKYRLISYLVICICAVT